MFIYLACPYSTDDDNLRQERVNIVTEISAKLINLGHIIFSPISYGQLMVDCIPSLKDREETFWWKLDFTFLRMCSKVWVLTLEGWKESRGVQKEIQLAKDLKIPIVYLSITDNLGLQFGTNPKEEDK